MVYLEEVLSRGWPTPGSIRWTAPEGEAEALVHDLGRTFPGVDIGRLDPGASPPADSLWVAAALDRASLAERCRLLSASRRLGFRWLALYSLRARHLERVEAEVSATTVLCWAGRSATSRVIRSLGPFLRREPR